MRRILLIKQQDAALFLRLKCRFLLVSVQKLFLLFRRALVDRSLLVELLFSKFSVQRNQLQKISSMEISGFGFSLIFL